MADSINWEDVTFDDLADSDELDPELRFRLNAEWATAMALRDMTGIANKGRCASYKQTFDLGQQLIPQLFDPQVSLLNKEEYSELTRMYIQQAHLESTKEGKEILPESIAKKDRDHYFELLDMKKSVLDDTDLISKRISSIDKSLEELRKRKHTENSLIFRDAFQVNRIYPISGKGKNYREFQVSDHRALRVRVLHPDKPEHATGADLIYENYWIRGNKTLVRLVTLQYKLWKNKSLYIDVRMEKQLQKLKMSFCSNDMCTIGENSSRKDTYRLPYCSAFLRPSEELQATDASKLSLGCYTPICVVEKLKEVTENGNAILRSKMIRSQSVSHKVFEEMFNIDMLGSRWFTSKDVESFYRDHSILDPDEKIIIHAQEIPFVQNQ